MADADDIKGQEDVDISDETQDFQFLNTLKHDAPTIPRRGEKDFETHGTAAQEKALARSREAMHDAISAGTRREHVPKTHILGIWCPGRNRCAVLRPRGTYFKSIGQQDRKGVMWLLPEEMLYLLERGNLDVRWPEPDQDEEAEMTEEAISKCLPMSVQGGYACAIGGEEGLSLEEWVVYSGLRRTGFAVFRAPKQSATSKPSSSSGQSGLGLLEWLTNYFQRQPSARVPLVKPGLYRSYDDIHRMLQIIPASAIAETQTTIPPFRITFHVHKPSPTFRKSDPGEPEFRVAVVNAREEGVMDLEQIEGLLGSVPLDLPRNKKPGKNVEQARSDLTVGAMYSRLKHGRRNCIMAIVDQGVVSYLRLAEGEFSSLPPYTVRGQGRKGRR